MLQARKLFMHALSPSFICFVKLNQKHVLLLLGMLKEIFKLEEPFFALPISATLLDYSLMDLINATIENWGSSGWLGRVDLQICTSIASKITTLFKYKIDKGSEVLLDY